MKTLLDRRKSASSAVGNDSLPPPSGVSSGPRPVRNWRAWSVCAAAAVLLAYAAHGQQLQPDAGLFDDAGTSDDAKSADAIAAASDAGAASIDGGLAGEIDAGRAQPARAHPRLERRGAADVDEESDEMDDEALERAMPEGESEEAEVVSDAGPAETPSVVSEVPAAAANAVAQTAPVPGLSLLHKAKLESNEEGQSLTAEMADGKTARLSINPALQAQMTRLFSMYKPMGGALVAIEPKTGRVLALVEYAADGHAEGAATRPLYPAASVFKIITGAALLEKGILPSAETCYHGGLHGIVGKLLKDTRQDRRCLSLSMALAKSANVVFAKMAEKHLDAKTLREEAAKFLFNRSVWSDPAVTASTANIPDQGLEFAKSAAGFGDVKLSPLHAALIAAAVGNGGDMPDPTLIDSIDGVPAAHQGERRILRAETAATLKEMMKLTVSEGTAAHSFRERNGAILGDIEVAGKTGSLSSHHEKLFKDYSWFVGFAPADDPKIAVAAVVVNGLKWSIHAPYVAREALRAYLVGGQLGVPPANHVKHVRRRAKKHS